MPLYARRSHHMLVRDECLSGTLGVLCLSYPWKAFRDPAALGSILPGSDLLMTS